MQRGRNHLPGKSPWKTTPSPLRKPVGEPYSGTDPKRLWLLRSRPDQVHRRTMRRGPPSKILAELRVARSASLLLGGPEGLYVRPLPGPPPEGEGGRLCFACLGGSLRFALLYAALPWRVIGLSGSGAREAELRVARSASLLLDGPRGAVCAPPPRPSPLGEGGRRCFACLGGSLRFALLYAALPWRVIGLSGSGAREAELRVARSASLLLGGPRGAVCAPPPRPSPLGEGGRRCFACLGGSLRFALLLFYRSIQARARGK
ncbi:hypothetical protein BN2877_30580 [Achromobacter xylosoxidans]|nr:hypothetical protein BN2877_30580 [Achromobacter xylosoxidans]